MSKVKFFPAIRMPILNINRIIIISIPKIYHKDLLSISKPIKDLSKIQNNKLFNTWIG